VSRSALEVADIFRDHGPAWRRTMRGHLSHAQIKVMSAIEACRTADLGGHVARCANPACGHTAIAFNSCLMGKASNGELVAVMLAYSCGLPVFHSP
jgi:hypothetical protein